MLSQLQTDRDPMRYQPDGFEEVTVGDGIRTRISAIKPGDAKEVLRGFGRLSRRSRYMRFMSARNRLSPADLAYLTEVDGRSHFALTAQVLEGGRWTGVAVARFVQLSREPDTVEAAITVIDDYQGRGLGMALGQRLLTAASERGYARVRAEVLAENRRMLRLLRGTGRPVVLTSEGSCVIAEIALGTGTEGVGRASLDLGCLQR